MASAPGGSLVVTAPARRPFARQGHWRLTPVGLAFLAPNLDARPVVRGVLDRSPGPRGWLTVTAPADRGLVRNPVSSEAARLWLREVVGEAYYTHPPARWVGSQLGRGTSTIMNKCLVILILVHVVDMGGTCAIGGKGNTAGWRSVRC